MTPETRLKRSRKLIKPRIQLRLIGAFAGVSLIGLTLQSLLLGSKLSDGGMMSSPEELPGLLMEILLVSFTVLLPLTVAVGVLVTFKLAGPIYRFEQHFERLARGEDVGPCKIRKGDYLQTLCGRINEALEYLASQRSAEATMSDEKRAA